MQARPYQVCLYVGAKAPEMPGVNVVNITPDEPTIASAVKALQLTDLKPADLRARVLFYADGETFEEALISYSIVLGFAGRRIDFTAGDEIIIAGEVDAGARKVAAVSRPVATVPVLQVGPALRNDLPSLDSSAGLSLEAIAGIKYARSLRFVPTEAAEPAVAAISQLLVLAAIRARPNGDRLPILAVGDEPAEVAEDEVVGIDLDTARREGMELRRLGRQDDRNAIADKEELSEFQKKLLAASALSIEETLLRLGARQNEQTSLWHCPRPDRHTNGDANASMKATAGTTQCFRCDPERVDSLRLTMDTKDYTVDEAADWLLNGK